MDEQQRNVNSVQVDREVRERQHREPWRDVREHMSGALTTCAPLAAPGDGSLRKNTRRAPGRTGARVLHGRVVWSGRAFLPASQAASRSTIRSEALDEHLRARHFRAPAEQLVPSRRPSRAALLDLAEQRRASGRADGRAHAGEPVRFELDAHRVAASIASCSRAGAQARRRGTSAAATNAAQAAPCSPRSAARGRSRGLPAAPERTGRS